MENHLKEKLDKLFEEKLDVLIEKKIIKSRDSLYDLNFITIEKLKQISEEFDIDIYDLYEYYSQEFDTKNCEDA